MALRDGTDAGHSLSGKHVLQSAGAFFKDVVYEAPVPTLSLRAHHPSREQRWFQPITPAELPPVSASFFHNETVVTIASAQQALALAALRPAQTQTDRYDHHHHHVELDTNAAIALAFLVGLRYCPRRIHRLLSFI